LIAGYVKDTLALLRTRTAAQTGAVTAGTMTSAGLRLLLMLVLADALAPHELGALVVFIALMDVGAIACESGLNAVLVRYVAARPDRRPSDIVLRCLGIKLALCGVVIAVLAAVYPVFISNPKIPADYAVLYPVAVASAIFLSFNTFVMAISQSRGRYAHYAFQAALINALRLVVLAVMLQRGVRDAKLICLVFFAVPPVAVAVGLAFVRAALRGTQGLAPQNVPVKELVSFMLPLALLQVIVVITMRVDVIMLQAMTDWDVVGNYGLAYQVAYALPLLAGALFTVLLPKVSAMRTPEELAAYRKKVLHVYPLVLIASAAGILIGPPIITLLFADKYAAALPIVRLNILNFGIYSIVNPLALIFYSLKLPYRLVALHVVQLLVLVPLNWLLIPRFQGLGPAMAVTVISVLGIAAIIPMTGAAIRRFAAGNTTRTETS